MLWIGAVEARRKGGGGIELWGAGGMIELSLPQLFVVEFPLADDIS